MPALRTLSLPVKLAAAFLCVCTFLLVVMLAIVIPKEKQERLDAEMRTMERLLTNMEHQVLLTMHVAELFGESSRSTFNLEIRNKFHEIGKAWQSSDRQEPQLLVTQLNEKFQGHPCHALLTRDDVLLFSSKPARPEIGRWLAADDLRNSEWSSNIYSEPLNICPVSNKEILLVEQLSGSPYRIGVYCRTPDLAAARQDFETSIGAILRQSFTSIKDGNPGFAYLMWVDGSDRPCDHAAGLRRDSGVTATEHNRICCVSEASPTQQPLTGTLLAGDYLQAADSGQPIRHLLDKPDAPGDFRHPAITWVRRFQGKRPYPFVLAVTLYEDAVYGQLDLRLDKFLHAGAIAVAGAFGLGLLLFQRFAKNISRLSQVAKSVKSGNLGARCGIRGGDDIGILGETFDAMIDTLEDNIQTLDSKVAKRTEKLKDLVREKEVLLKEVHHRVKNNLAVIISLIKLKEDQTESAEARQLLTELQERIYAIELLHHQLYQSRNLKEIPFQDYLLRLLDNIRQTYATDESGIAIRCDVLAGEFAIEEALACGLLINECTTNALKHAFGADGGRIDIGFTCVGSNCHLVVADDGKGLPKNLALRPQTTLGMQLIRGIVENQLQGRIDFIVDRGTRIEIRFSKR